MGDRDDTPQGTAGQASGWPRPAVAWRLVLPAAAAQLAALALGATGYGYHRDELYYRMLSPAWGYVDQPPLTPFLARLTTSLADEVWALRLPAMVAASLSVVVLALVCRELGGGRGSQALAAWGYAFAAMPLMLGHLLLTSTVDLLLLLLVVLVVLRPVRAGPHGPAARNAWLLAGLVVGVTALNRLLVVVVVASLVAGLVLLGPRRTLATPWPWAAAVVAAAVGSPTLVFQATHGWPQLAMGAALAENNAAEVRAQFVPLLLVMLGPPLTVVWVLGTAWLLRPVRRHEVGFLAVGFLLVLLFTLASGAQPHYPVHLLSVVYAAGCVPVARWLASRRTRRVVAVALLVVNAAVSVVIALPVVPLGAVGRTPLPGIGPLVGDQVGWQRYVGQIAAAYRSASPTPTAVVTSNYGEAGAIARYGGPLGLPAPYSGQNALFDQGRPPDGTRSVLVVGFQLEAVRPLFARCAVLARLDNGLDVDNEEQGAPVALCADPLGDWSTTWEGFRHLD